MPSFIPAPNCALVEVLGNQDGKACEFTCAAEYASGYVLSNLVALAGAVDGWVNTQLLGFLGNNVMYEGVTVRGLESDADLRYDLSEPLPGGGPNAAVPAQVACVLTKYTGFTGRSQRGRLYVFGLDESLLADTRHITTSAQTNLNTAFAAFITAVIGVGWEPVVLSYFHDHAPRVTAQIKPITDLIVRDTRLDTQRRRVGRS